MGTLGSAVLAFLEFRESHPRHDLAGEWRVENEILSTAFRPYEGLRIGYTIALTQRGADIAGSGEKSSENGRLLSGKARTALEVSGTVRGDRVTATFTEKGERRRTIGTFVWTLSESDRRMTGTFTSTAADSRGRSTAVRVP